MAKDNVVQLFQSEPDGLKKDYSQPPEGIGTIARKMAITSLTNMCIGLGAGVYQGVTFDDNSLGLELLAFSGPGFINGILMSTLEARIYHSETPTLPERVDQNHYDSMRQEQGLPAIDRRKDRTNACVFMFLAGSGSVFISQTIGFFLGRYIV